MMKNILKKCMSIILILTTVLSSVMIAYATTSDVNASAPLSYVTWRAVDSTKWDVTSQSFTSKDSTLKIVQSSELFDDKLSFSTQITFLQSASSPSQAGFDFFTKSNHKPHSDGYSVVVDYTSTVKQISIVSKGAVVAGPVNISITQNSPITVKAVADSGLMKVYVNTVEKLSLDYSSKSYRYGRLCLFQVGSNAKFDNFVVDRPVGTAF